jgi:hypothetical protein
VAAAFMALESTECDQSKAPGVMNAVATLCRGHCPLWIGHYKRTSYPCCYHHIGYDYANNLSSAYSGFRPILGCSYHRFEPCCAVYVEQKISGKLVRLDSGRPDLHSALHLYSLIPYEPCVRYFPDNVSGRI